MRVNVPVVALSIRRMDTAHHCYAVALDKNNGSEIWRSSSSPEQGYSPPTIIEVGDFRVDLENRSVAVKGSQVYLTPKEYDLMVYLVSHPGKVLTHRTLLTSIWGGESAEQTEYLRVFVGQLRFNT